MACGKLAFPETTFLASLKMVWTFRARALQSAVTLTFDLLTLMCQPPFLKYMYKLRKDGQTDIHGPLSDCCAFHVGRLYVTSCRRLYFVLGYIIRSGGYLQIVDKTSGLPKVRQH